MTELWTHEPAPAAPSTRAFAYVDADWSGGASPPSLVVQLDGTLEWDGVLTGNWAGSDPDRAAAAALVAVARSAVEAVGDGPARVSVIGRGFVATAVRELLGTRHDSLRGDPAAVIDTSGDAARIAAALSALPDLATLVLAGEACGGPTPLDLYADVHVRGLRLVAVAPPLAAGGGERDNFALAHRLLAVHPPVYLDPADELSRPAAWYRYPLD